MYKRPLFITVGYFVVAALSFTTLTITFLSVETAAQLGLGEATTATTIAFGGLGIAGLVLGITGRRM